MTFARLLLEIRRRAAHAPHDVPRSTATAQIAREVLDGLPPGLEANRTREIMGALLGIDEGRDFDASALDQLTPEAVLRIDMLAQAILEFGRTTDAVNAIRAAIIRPVD